MARRESRRSLAIALLAGVLAIGLGGGDAYAKTVKINSKKERHGVFVFSVKRVRSAKIVSARLRVAKATRRISVNRVRSATKKGVFRARAPRKLLYKARAASRKRPRATLVLTAGSRGSTTGTGTSLTQGTSTDPAQDDVTSLPNTTCSGPFGAGSWPGSCWRPYSGSSPFNQRIPDNPRLAANSSGIVQRVLGFGSVGKLAGGRMDAGDDWNHPTYYSKPTDPVFTLHCSESWGRCDIEGMQIRIPDPAKPAAGGDAHMTVVDQASGWEYDFWQVSSKPAGGGTLTMSWGGRTRIDGDGLHSDATAAQFGNLAGIIRAPELIDGSIDHALFITMKCDSGDYVYPASKSGRSCADSGLSTSDAPPMGTRLQLAMSDDQIAGLGLPKWKTAILTAMAHYGMYFGDTGGGGIGLQTESSATYTSFGVADPLLDWAKTAPGAVVSNGNWVLDIAGGVDWTRYLRVVDPCVAQGTC
jgi:hypothetical protein